jgi:large subunit ribosomal protein L25
LQFVGEDVAPGFKKGGVLNIVHRTVEAKCTADKIPEFFTVDLSKAEIGDGFNAFDIQMPEGVSLSSKEDFTVASVVAPQEETAAANTTASAEAEKTEEKK